jgi:PPE-repeat protein
MDFAALPPEITSGQMYSGPGSRPLLAAAAAWDGLAAELRSTATAYGSEVSGLSDGPWQGPSSASMAAAAATYVDWLTATATQAEQTAAQAKVAASAYATAFAITVPPPVIADNRALLTALVAANLLGQNTAAIAATEAQYGEMWAQDAAAMYGYAYASASAATLGPFTPPVSSTNPGGLAAQAGALAQAAGTPASANIPTIWSELTSAIPTALQGLASPLQSTSTSASGLAGILSAFGLDTPISFLTPINTGLTATSLSGAYAAWGSATHADTEIIGTQNMLGGTESRIMDRLDRLISLPSSSATTPVGVAPTAVSASSGRAALVSGLAVPQAWAANAPEMRAVAWTSPAVGLSAADQMASSPGILSAEMVLASMAIARRPTGAGSHGPARWPRPPATARLGSEPPQNPPGGGPWTGIAAELTQLAQLRDSGVLTDQEFDRQKRRLLGD